MRFNQISLTRFGCFTDHFIDLAEASSSGDFHIVYGPNEAGKSTLRDACIDFLYGIAARSQYNFLHDYAVMEVGARVTAGGKPYEAKRIKGRKDTLIGMGDSPLSGTTLSALLGGISREGYEHMYSLNDASLEAGGESILSSEGDLGALLFGAMSGLSDISFELTKTKEQTEQFFKVSGRGGFRLKDLKSELKRIDQEISDNDVDAGVYKRLKKEAKQAESQWQSKKAERDEKRTESRRLQALIEAHPIWREYIAVQDHLTPLGDAPAVPDGWADEVDELIRKNTEARSKAEAETQAVARARTELDTIVCDETGLSLADQVKRLQQDDLEARYRTSNDIERRRLERRHLQDGIEDKLRGLGQSVEVDPKRLILPVARVGEIKSLMATAGEIESDLKSSLREWENAKSETEEAQQALDAYQGPDDDPVKIQTALALAKDAPKPADLKATEDAVNKRRAERDGFFGDLSPWQGDAAALSSLTLPHPALMQKLENQGKALHEQSRGLATEYRQLQDNLAEQVSIIDTLLQEVKVISDEAAADVRLRREAAWISHRDSLDETPLLKPENLQQSADNFAAALAADDQLVTKRFTQSTEIARLRKAQLDRATTQTKLDRWAESQREHDAEKHAYARALEALYSTLNLPADFELAELKVWVERCKQALSAQEHLKTVETDCQTRRDQYQRARTALEDALRSYGLDIAHMDWPELQQLAQETIERWTQARQKKAVLEESLAKAEKALAKRKRALDRVQAEKAAWSSDWSSCLNETWLGEQVPAAVEEMLNTLSSLMAEVKEAGQLSDRIAAMASDRKRYCSEVQRLAQLAGEQCDETEPLTTADRLRKRVGDAEEALRAKQKASKALKEAEERLAIETRIEQQIALRFEQLRATIPAENLAELRSKIGQGLERARLHGRLAELENDLKRRLNQDSMEASLVHLEDRVGTPQRLDEAQTQYEALERDLADVDQQVSELYASWQQLQKQLQTIGSDSTAAELVELRQALLLEIEAEAHAFMRLSTGIMLANEALRTYRETHRSSMLEAASGAFSRITRGAFKGLSTAPRNDRELLFGVRADGSTLLAAEMSRGTRYQLYLALRIAGHAELARNGETLPFFADDILEPFDDDRSSETFLLLNEMAKHGQVIYLTHHQHLCELARKVTDGRVEVHELPDRAVPSSLIS